MTSLKSFFVLAVLVFASFIVHASPIHFDLRASIVEDLDGTAQFDYQSADLTATIFTNVGVLNRTNNGFGVDIVGSGCDNSDAIDRSCSGAEGETVSVWFDQRVHLISATISGLTGGDTARWVLPDFGFLDFQSAGIYSFGQDVYLEAGQAFSWTSIADNSTSTQRGFSFDGFTVSTEATQAKSVFEPATTILFSTGLILIFIRRQKQTTKSHKDYIFYP